MTKEYLLKPESSCRLDAFLREELPRLLAGSEADVSNSKIRRLIIAGAVAADGRQCRIPSWTLRAGNTVKVTVDEEKFFFEKQPDDVKFDVSAQSVLFEDEYIIVVNKPAFFPTEETIAGRRDNMHDAVVRWLWSENPSLRNPPYAGIMHRLDRETSGVLLFTKQRTVNTAVHDMFEQHTARKIYRAVVLRESCKTVRSEFYSDSFLGRISAKSSAGKWGIVSESSGGLHAHTDFTLKGEGITEGRNVMYIEARPFTGRTHQIRVHLSSLGMPILGDTLYSGVGAERMYLHALSLSFPHPVSGEIVTVSAPLPPGFGRQ